MIALLLFAALALTTMLLPRVGGVLMCVTSVAAGCVEIERGVPVNAALAFVYGLMFGVMPFVARRITRPRSRNHTAQP